jgi:hypothetical protein
VTGQGADRVAANDQATGLAIDFGEHGFGGDDAFKTIGHGITPSRFFCFAILALQRYRQS